MKYEDQGTNPDIIKPYIKELLSDEQPHSIREIKRYVLEMTGGIGDGGAPITTSMISSALYNMVLGDENYNHLRRGWYQKGIVKEQVPIKNEKQRLYDNAKSVIDRSISNFDQVFTINYLTTEFSLEELSIVGNAGKEIRQLFHKAKDILEQNLSEICMEESEAEDMVHEEEMTGGMKL